MTEHAAASPKAAARHIAWLFDAQTELLAGVAGPLEVELARVEAARAADVERPDDLDAYLAFQRALATRPHRCRGRRQGAPTAAGGHRPGSGLRPSLGATNGPRRTVAPRPSTWREAIRLAPSSGESWFAPDETDPLAERIWNDCLATSNEAVIRNQRNVSARTRLTMPLA